MIWHCVIPVKAVGKGRPRVTKSGNAFTPVKTRLVSNQIKYWLLANKPKRIFDGALEVSIEFWFIKPKSAPKKRYYPTVKPDLDNCDKLVLDCCNKIIWNDDAQIVDLYSQKRYGIENQIVVKVREL